MVYLFNFAAKVRFFFDICKKKDRKSDFFAEKEFGTVFVGGG